MAEVAAGVLYAAETVAEGAVALAKGIYTPTAPLKATFRQLKAPSIQRSSHTISVVKGRAYIFGGEIKPRQPVSNDVDVLILPAGGELQDTDHQSVPAKPAQAGGEVPAARVGHSAAVIGHHVLIFGGRGGKDMAALEENGRVWAFDTQLNTWSYLDPNPQSPHPSSRSYHCSAASEHPRASSTTSADVGLNHGTFFVHAGCPSSGGRTSDLWAFDISSRSWAQVPSAPDPPRGGTSIALVKDRLYRFGGFDGSKELGGQVDWLDVAANTFNDKGGVGEMALQAAPAGWQTDVLAVGSEHGAGGGPANRSVAGLLPVSTGQGRQYLLIVCGETDPSNRGHDGAGKFLDDVWSFQLKPEGNTAASTKDAIKGPVLGKQTGEREVHACKLYDADGKLVQESQQPPMKGRGWFASCTVDDLGEGANVLVHGGLEESNERLGDAWLIGIE